MSKAPETSRSDSRRGSRGKTRGGSSGRRDAAAPASVPSPALDEETAAALTLYNTYLVADREQQAHERAVRKAEKAKDDAAAALRKLNDRTAPAAQTSEAEAKYREAVDALRRLRDGQAATPKGSDDEAVDADEADEGAGGAATTTDDDETAATGDTPADKAEPSTADEAAA